jgi:hypothetical protein
MAERSASYLASSSEASVTLCYGESNAVTFVSKIENISVLDESPWDLIIVSTAEQLVGWMRHEFLISPNRTNARESFYGIDGCRWLAQLLSRSLALPFGMPPVDTGIDDFANMPISTTRHSDKEDLQIESTQLCNMDTTTASSKLAPKLLFCLVKNGFLTYSCGGTSPDETVMMERSSVFSFDLPPELMNASYVYLTPSRHASEVSKLLLEMATNCPFSQMPQPRHDVALRMDHLSCELQRVRLEGMNSKDLLCFYINIYNFMVVHAKLKGKLPCFLGTNSHNRDRIAAFQKISYLMGNKIHNLFNIECSLLGRSLRDSVNMTSQFSSWDTTSTKSKSAHSTISPEPRLLFLLCKGSVSCPKIRMVTAANLQLTLKTAMKEYIAVHRNLPANHSKLKSFFQGYQNTLWMPRIFKWHAGDFGLSAYDTIMFYLDQLEDYESRDFRSTIKLTRCSTKVEFHAFDWTDSKTNWFAPELEAALPLQSVPSPPIHVEYPTFQRHVLASPRHQLHASSLQASLLQRSTPRSAPLSPQSPTIAAAIPFSPPPALFSPRDDLVPANIPSSARKFVTSEKKLPVAQKGHQAVEFPAQLQAWDLKKHQAPEFFSLADDSSRSRQRMHEIGKVSEIEVESQAGSSIYEFAQSSSRSMDRKSDLGPLHGLSPTLPAYNSYVENMMQYQYEGETIETDSEEFSESEDDTLSHGSFFLDDATITSQSTMPLHRQSRGRLQASSDPSTLTVASNKLDLLSDSNAIHIARSANTALESAKPNMHAFLAVEADSF